MMQCHTNDGAWEKGTCGGVNIEGGKVDPPSIMASVRKRR